MMRRILPLVVGLSVALSVAASTLAGSAAQAAPIAAPSVAVRQIHGPDSPALERAIGYWNGLAGRQVLSYGGMFDGGSESPQSVAVQVAAVPAGLVGLTQGNVGSSPLVVTVDPSAAADWVVWAHELGHTLGLHHHDGPGYAGVMRPVPQDHKVRRSDDRRLVALFV